MVLYKTSLIDMSTEEYLKCCGAEWPFKVNILLKTIAVKSQNTQLSGKV